MRRDMYTGTETTYPLPTVNLPIDLRAASNRFAFFETEAALSPDDTNGTSDFYAFDRSENVYRLISSRQGLRQAAGGVTDFATSPKGNQTIFGSAAPGVSDLVSNGFGQLYARSTIRFDTHPALVAVGPGGREAREAVASRNGTAVFTNRFVSGQWSLRILVDGQPPRVLPTSSEMRPLDVTDDGSRALFMGETTGELVLWENGIFRPLQAGGFYGNFGKIDPKTGIPVVVLDRSGPTGLQQELIRFDPLTGIGTRIDTQAPIVYYGFDVDAGRVAWKTLDSIRVLDLTTGASLQIPQIRDRFYGPRLTSDGVYVGVAQTLANGDPEATRVYRVSDGSLRRNLSFGELLPDGKWLSDSERGELIQASNGARISDTIPLDETLGGTPVGPLRFTFRKVRREEGPYPGDLWRYRAVALPLPATTSHGAYPTADGHASLEATFRKAGLENASTWNEYRIDGAGGWRRIKTGTNASVQLTPGRHRIEIRAADALGRVEAVPKESYVVADFDPPTFGAIEIVPEFGYLEIETDAFDGIAKVQRSDRPYENTYSTVRQGEILRAFIGSIEPGVTYRIRFSLRDQAGNEVLTPELTYP
ncbi:hypothetical protein EON79_01790 [bacterium]|nr:MAG: hypothetical protein EON79_01790 [bacterium]